MRAVTSYIIGPLCILAPAAAGAQPVDPKSQYVEWPVESTTLACEPIAVSPELDAMVRRREASGVTRLFAIAAGDQRLRLLTFASHSGIEREHQTLDRLAFDRLHRCKLTSGPPYDLLLEVHWQFDASGGKLRVVTKEGSPRELVQPMMLSDRCTQPAYPSASLASLEQGVTRLQFLVDSEGKVVHSTVRSSSGSPRLDAAAQSALSACPFTPATLRGEPLGGLRSHPIEYVWRLR